MAFRNLIITRKSNLQYKNNCLNLIQDNEELSIPLDDINCILVETRDTMLSSFLLSECSRQNIIVFFCDEKHMPVGVLNSFYGHSRQVKRINEQISQSEPFKKNIWQRIVKSKIYNQSRVLEILGNFDEAKILEKMSSSVKSGDKDNMEATSAARYFKQIFGKDFDRQSIDTRNAVLNYGYAIIRGIVARTLVQYGLIPSYGVFHRNEYNNFNLADDFIEPFRPIVDLSLFQMVKSPIVLDKETKGVLLSLLTVDIKISDKLQTITNAIDIMIQSYISSINEKDVDKLITPELVSLRLHKYG